MVAYSHHVTMDTVALRMWADLRCAICEQTPDNTRWGEFAANEPTKPMNNLCFECEDTCKRRWPMMHKFEVQTRAKQDDQFRGQVKQMTQVKLGQAAKLFIPQEVEATETVGFRVEEELVPMDEDTFKATMGTATPPEKFSELKAHPFQMPNGSTRHLYLFANPKAMPRVIMWRQSSVSGTEQKLAAADCLDSQQGQELQNRFQKLMMDSKLPMHIPTIESTKTMVQQRRPPPEEPAPSPGMPALCNVGALPGGAGGSQPATHGVAAQGIGGTSALLAMQLKGGAATQPSTPAPKAKQKVAGGGSSAPDTKRRKSEQSSRALDMALPQVEACFKGESGVQGKSCLQLCHSWKTQHESKYQRREISQHEYISGGKDHRLRVMACSLSAQNCANVNLAELKRCLREILAIWEQDLPLHVFVAVLARVIEDVWRQPTSLEVRIKCVTDIASPQPPQQRDGEIQALKDVPTAKLREEGRWRVAHDLWLEAVIPKLMTVKSLDSSSLQTALASVISLAGSGDAQELASGNFRDALAETCGILCTPVQDTPITANQLSGLRRLFTPQGTTNHITVLEQLIDSDWRAALKNSLGFSISEAQSAQDIGVMVEGLQGSGADDAWETLLQRWPQWHETLRPRTLQHIADQARANMEKHLEQLQSGSNGPIDAAAEGLTLIHRCTAFAGMVQQHHKEEWEKLGNTAKAAYRHCTADLRWSKMMAACQKVQDQAEEVCDLDWAAVVAELAAECDQCKGMCSREENHIQLIAAIRRCFHATACSEESLSLASRLTNFLPEAVEPELRKMAAASLTASRLVVLGGAPGPAALDGVQGSAAASTEGAEQPLPCIQKLLDEFKYAVAECQSPIDIAVWPEVMAMVESLNKHCTLRAKTEAELAKASWQQAIDDLRKHLELCNWKQRLPAKEERVWAHVLREMEYRFWASSANPITSMDAKMEALLAAQTEYTQICTRYDIEPDTSIEKAHNSTKVETQVVLTEEYLARHLHDGSTSSLAKIGKRVNAIIKEFPYDSLCPLIRKAVKDATLM